MFKEIFIQLLQSRNITAYKLSKDTGISQALISNWKKGTKIPASDNLLKIADYFNVSIDYLLGKENLIENKTNILQEDTILQTEHIGFLERLKSLCKEKSLNISVLLKDLELNPNSIKNWEKGNFPNIQILIQIADYFHCSTDYLLGRTDNPTDNQMTQIIERISFLLKVNKFTAKKLTDDLQLPNGAISEWKKGKSEPSPEELQKIADYFRQPLEWLLTGKGNEAMPKMEGHSYIYIGGIDGTHEFIPVPEEKM